MFTNILRILVAHLLPMISPTLVFDPQIATSMVWYRTLSYQKLDSDSPLTSRLHKTRARLPGCGTIKLYSTNLNSSCQDDLRTVSLVF